MKSLLKGRSTASVVRKVTVSRGSSGLEDLRRLYPDSRFYWRDPWGLVVFWNPASERMDKISSRILHNVPLALMNAAGLVEDILSGQILKDREGDGSESLAREMVEDLDVVRVMHC